MDRIVGVAQEEENTVTTAHKNLSYRKVVRMRIGNKKVTSTHQLQECVEEHKKNTTRHMNHDRYQYTVRFTTRCIPGMTGKIPWIIC